MESSVHHIDLNSFINNICNSHSHCLLNDNVVIVNYREIINTVIGTGGCRDLSGHGRPTHRETAKKGRDLPPAPHFGFRSSPLPVVRPLALPGIGKYVSVVSWDDE